MVDTSRRVGAPNAHLPTCNVDEVCSPGVALRVGYSKQEQHEDSCRGDADISGRGSTASKAFRIYWSSAFAATAVSRGALASWLFGVIGDLRIRTSGRHHDPDAGSAVPLVGQRR